MSAIAPDKQEIIKELYSRRDTLTPDKKAVVDELASRIGLSAAPAPRGATGSFDLPTAGSRPVASPINPLYRVGETAKAGIEGTAGVGEGATQLVTGAPGMVATAADALKDMLTGKGTSKAQQVIESMVSAPAHAVKNLGNDALALGEGYAEDLGLVKRPAAGPRFLVSSPGQQQEYQNFAGQNAASVLAPEAIEQAKPYVKAAGRAAVEAPGNAADYLRDRFKPKPEISLLRATGSSNPELPAKIPAALDELAAWSDATGKAVDSAPVARQAINERMSHYNAISDQIAGPQRGVVVPGSRAELAQAKIAAIPDEIRLNNPKQYANKVKTYQDAAQLPDYTIGELDDLRKDLAVKNKAYGKNLSGQITAEHSNAAIDAAAEKYARAKFYDSLFENSGDTSVKDLKSRIGSLIELDNALRPRVNQSIVESGKPFMQRAVETTGKAMTPGTTLKHFGENATIDSDIASATRQWQGRPTPIQAGAAKLPNPITPGFRKPLALPAATSQFQIDPSAGELYGQPTAADRLRGITRKAAELGEGIPMRDVTPPARKMLNPAPAKITTYIQRSSGKTFEMPAPVKALLDKWIEERKALPPAKPKQLTAASALGGRVFNMGGDPSILDQAALEHMKTFADVQESGIGELTGKLKRQENPEMLNAGEAIKQRFGGFKKNTIFSELPYGPKQMAEAVRRGSGKVYNDMLHVARNAVRDYAEQVMKKQAEEEANFTKETEGWD